MAMRMLTTAGRNRLAEIARRHGVSEDAAGSMLAAVTNGGGTMAQFSHPELSGSGQWMRGGMTMVGDMFNSGLKATVDNLCGDLSDLLLNPAPGMWRDAAPQGPETGAPFSPGFGGGNWWPAELGSPNASGAQNDLRYACFGDARRLAVEIAGVLTVYDTADHWISGVSQQQGNGWTLTFTSQYGTVPVSSLRVVEGESRPAEPAPAPGEPFRPASPVAPAPTSEGLASSVWSFGSADGAATDMLTLAPEGVLSGSGDTRLRYWSVEDGSLTFYDADGRPSARFAVPSDGTARSGLTGQDPNHPRQAYALRPPGERVEPEAPRVVDNVPLDVTRGGWTLEDIHGNRLCDLRLRSDGQIEGGRGGEAAWRIKDCGVVFLHGSGRPTARFETFQFRAGRWTLIGAPMSDPSAALFLKQS